MASKSDVVWSFGYGSNMDVVSLQAKKHVKIVEHACAVLKGWRLVFNLHAMQYSEPSYANVQRGEEGDEVHGVAFCMTKESGEELDRTESGYKKEIVKLHAYDGRVFEGFLYVNESDPSKPPKEEVPPSSRYLGILVKGAKAAGLQEDYIKNLSEHEVYRPSEETLAKRKALPKPEDLPKITVEELAKHGGDSDEPWIGVLGYVIARRTFFKAHMGRDTTTRFLNQFYAIPMDDNDDAGRPPYPILNDLDPAAVEYVASWRDHYILKSRPSNIEGKVIGFVKEFLEQQKSGKTTWKLPEIPK